MNIRWTSIMLVAALFAPASHASDEHPPELWMTADTVLLPTAEAREAWNRQRGALQPVDAQQPSSEMRVVTLPSGEELAVCTSPGLPVDNLQGALRRGAHRAELPQ